MIIWHQTRGASGRKVSKSETKLCALCGALNYHRNVDCRTCGWRGTFDREGAALDFHWQRLSERHEEVRLEHVVARGTQVLGDFGVARRASVWRRLRAACSQGWQVFQARRTARRAGNAPAPQHPQSTLPPK